MGTLAFNYLNNHFPISDCSFKILSFIREEASIKSASKYIKLLIYSFTGRSKKLKSALGGNR